MSHIFKLVRDIAPLVDGVKKTETFSECPGKFRKCGLECSIARNSIGNRFPVQKYVGAMLRSSIRVVLAAENEVSNPICLSSDFQFHGNRSSRRSSLYFTTRKSFSFFYTIYAGSHQLEIVTHVWDSSFTNTEPFFKVQWHFRYLRNESFPTSRPTSNNS